MKYRWIPSKYRIISGKNISNGRLELLVNKRPEFIYEQIGDFFYAETDGFVSIFKHVPNDPTGFGGSTITFTGTLVAIFGAPILTVLLSKRNA